MIARVRRLLCLWLDCASETGYLQEAARQRRARDRERFEERARIIEQKYLEFKEYVLSGSGDRSAGAHTHAEY